MKKWLIIALVAVVSLTAIIFFSIYRKSGTNEKYTSLIIDCSNMGLARGMSPKVLNPAGKEIYPGAAASGMNMKEVIESGVVTYQSSLENAKKHQLAGENPLIIKAQSIDGIIKSDPVINEGDAEKLANADNNTKFLVQHRVLFVQ